MSTGTLVDVVMPQMGVSVSEGTVVAWRKQVGEAVKADETIVEISTDKVDTEVPAPAAGTVSEILVQEGETVPVETRLAVIQTGDGPAPEPADDAPEPPAAEAATEEQPAAEAEPAAEQPEPAGAITASSVPTSTVSPSATRISATIPSPGLGTSVSTLSVEISSRASSAATASPSALSHFVIVPSETDTPIWGMTTSTAVPVAIAAS